MRKSPKNEQKGRGRGRLIQAVRSAQALRLLIGTVGTLALLFVFVIAVAPVRFNLEVGTVPLNTIAATRDVVDEISTQEKRTRAAAQVTPTYQYQEGVTESVLAQFDLIFTELRAVHQYGATLPNPSATRVYTADELLYAKDMLSTITLRDYQVTALLRCSQEELDMAYLLLYDSLQSEMQSRVIEGQTDNAISRIRDIVGYRMSIPLGQNVVPEILKGCVQPNMIINQAATEAARKEAMEKVEPVIFKRGQNIVVRGEGLIQENQIAMLSSLGLLRQGQVDLSLYIGAVMLVLLMVSCMLFLLARGGYNIVQDTAKLALLFMTLVISLGLCVLARLVDAYLMPTVLCAMLITALLGAKPGLICNVVLTGMAAALAAGGNDVYDAKMAAIIVGGLLSGSVAILMLQNKISKPRMLLVGAVAGAVDFLACFALAFMMASDLSASLQTGLMRVGSVAAGTVLSIALQPLLEMLFNLPTPVKLMELANQNQPLLRKLLLEAPGTYHHATIVASLAEAAAEAVGANPLLAKVGGYYHDIGKLKRPLYFKENQMGDKNIHDVTDPKVSAAIVTAHTKDGLSMAKAYRLPLAVQDMIANHHGDTPVMFFYHKALQLAGGKPVDIQAFRYDGHPPKTKEGAIILLCDTIEAAVRTMKNPTPDDIEEFIVKLVRGKLEDGQLSDSPLTLRDIDRICAAATTVLAGVFHERIEYPEMEDTGRMQTPLHREEADMEVELPAQEKDLAVEPPLPTALPVLDLEKQMPAPVVVPEALAFAPAVEPPPAVSPVEIDALVQLSPLRQKDAEEQETENDIAAPVSEDEEADTAEGQA